MRGPDAGRTLGRYFSASSSKRDKTGQNRTVVAQTHEDVLSALASSERVASTKTNVYRNDALEAYVRSKSIDGIRETRIEDGTVVRYGVVKFVDQPAIMSPSREVPADFTPAKLAEVQARFETLCATDFTGQMRRGTRPLANIDPALVLSLDRVPLGYVPVAVGASGDIVNQGYPAEW